MASLVIFVEMFVELLVVWMFFWGDKKIPTKKGLYNLEKSHGMTTFHWFSSVFLKSKMEDGRNQIDSIVVLPSLTPSYWCFRNLISHQLRLEVSDYLPYLPGFYQWDFQGPPIMGMVWEAYHKGVQLGVLSDGIPHGLRTQSIASMKMSRMNGLAPVESLNQGRKLVWHKKVEYLSNAHFF